MLVRIDFNSAQNHFSGQPINLAKMLKLPNFVKNVKFLILGDTMVSALLRYDVNVFNYNINSDGVLYILWYACGSVAGYEQLSFQYVRNGSYVN